MYRWIGRFTVKFSHLIGLLELALVGMLCSGHDELQDRGKRSASPVRRLGAGAFWG